jgi:hypothetical protein
VSTYHVCGLGWGLGFFVYCSDIMCAVVALGTISLELTQLVEELVVVLEGNVYIQVPV